MENLKTLTVQIEHQIATITLNRPDKKNAISFQMMDDLIKVAHKLKRNREIRAVILMGADGNFSSGLDLADLNNPKSLGFALYELAKPTPSKFQKVCLIWQSLPVPVIAVVEGVCVGGGLQLALGADIRIAAADARLSVLEAKWGLVADMGITRTARDIRRDVMKQIAMTAEMMDAPTAKDYGLLTHISDDPVQMAVSLTDAIKARSPDAVLAAKRVMDVAQRQDYLALYQEKLWQIKLMLGANRKLSIKKAKDDTVQFIKRQFR
ncbi:crotonase/enoyl-CoA hydratase family protein [Moraxella canis]|uniref:crotonase/enoyl-CoA hydratase family protein n=1 Tax=Moraxella canis TaxID=90239 RepID=UPI0006679D30|nr:crotonase/enoyl-CoA hydratase family protein [Moraxella canis]